MKFPSVILPSVVLLMEWKPYMAFTTSSSLVSVNKLSLSKMTHFNVKMNSSDDKNDDLTSSEVQTISDMILSSQYSAYFNSSRAPKDMTSELETVLKFWGRKRTKSDNERSEFILMKLEQDTNTQSLVNTKMYNILMNHWIDLDTPYGHQKAKALMDKMRQSSTIQPDTFSYTSIFRICNDASEAREMLQKMIQLSKDGNASVLPNTVTYNSVLRVIANSSDDKALEAAEEMINEMERVYKKHKLDGTLDADTSVIPNTITYTTLMNAYANSRKSDAVYGAQRIFQRMVKEYQEGNHFARPNVLAYNTYIKAWVNSRKQGNALHAEQILMDMIQKCQQDQSDDCVQPNVVSFSTVISGWAKSNQSGSEIRAAKVFNMMTDSYKAGNKSAKPNIVAYSSLIDAYIKSGNVKNLEFAEYIYDKLCTAYANGSEVQPTVILANQIMDAWSRSGADDAGLRAERILHGLEQMYQTKKNPELRPTTLNYTTVINVWAKSSSKEKAKKAKALLDRMILSYQEEGNSNAKPNVFTYTAVLNACAFCSGDREEKKEALQIATSTLKHMESSGYDQPNHVTYTTFLRVCLNLIPISDARDSAVRSLFQKCKSKNMVTESMFQLLQNNYSDDKLVLILDWKFHNKDNLKSTSLARDSNGRISFDALPLEWKSKSLVSEGRTNNSKGRNTYRPIEDVVKEEKESNILSIGKEGYLYKAVL